MKSHLKKLLARPLSPSSLSLWEDTRRDPDHKKWGEYYLEGIKREVSELEQARMDYGIEIHEKIARDPKFLPKATRYDSFEDEINVEFGHIPITGKLDTLRADLHAFADYKTTQTKFWSQETANESKQFLMYFALLYLKYDIQPKDVLCDVVVIHIEEVETGNFKVTRKLRKNPVEIFKVKHTLIEVVEFLGYIKKVRGE